MQLSLYRPSLDWLRDQIMALDLDSVTPLSALQMLYALKEQIRRRSSDNRSQTAPTGVKPDSV